MILTSLPRTGGFHQFANDDWTVYNHSDLSVAIFDRVRRQSDEHLCIPGELPSAAVLPVTHQKNADPFAVGGAELVRGGVVVGRHAGDEERHRHYEVQIALARTVSDPFCEVSLVAVAQKGTYLRRRIAR